MNSLRTVRTPSATWGPVLAAVIDQSHLVTGDQLSRMVDDAVRPAGLTAEVLLADLAQRGLRPISPEPSPLVGVEGTAAGRAYQLGEIQPTRDEHGGGLLWVPMLDGTERVGVLRIGLPSVEAVNDTELWRHLWSLAGLMGHIVVTKIAYSDQLRRLRNAGRLSAASELMWELLPPRTSATDRVVITALLEPCASVAGDAYDYAIDSETVDLAVFDGVGHDLQAGVTTALALTAIRNARRAGETDLAEFAARADELLVEQPGPRRFVTAILARLDARTGVLHYLVAGHPPPLLIRDGRMVKELAHPPRLPLGVIGAVAGKPVVFREQLEPGDRLLLYSDGITEARDAHGEFFGEQRLVDLAERAELDRLSAPETLRRLAAAVLHHQEERLQDDATLLMLDWSAATHHRMFPTFA